MEQETYPPDRSWRPGLLVVDRDLLESSAVLVTLETIEVYPTGVVIRCAARFQPEISLDEQRAAGARINSRHRDPFATSGPVLRVRQGPDLTAPEPEPKDWGHAGSGSLWRLSYWVPMTVGQGDLEIAFSWPGPADGSSGHVVDIDASRVQEACARARRVWSGPPEAEHRYFGNA